MKSIDTNVLLYALNADCAEHDRARALVARALDHPEEWIIADQVYFELYRLLRNPAVLAHPLGARQASDAISWYRTRSGWLHCAYEPSMMADVSRLWSSDGFSARATFDAVLAVTLARNGVHEFFTRNTGVFAPLELFSVQNPIDT